ncbi:MAG: DUF262 domain-containing HNH endonuclease family protein, partial [Actinomycetota bacterium]
MFQRPYVWNKTKHWEPLWDDVRTTTERYLRQRRSSGGGSSVEAEQRTVPHFLGAIVVDQVPTDTLDVEARHVIDGQQRLTTLQLLLDSVQEVLSAHGLTRDAKLLSKLVLNDEDVVTRPDDCFKVWPTSVDQEAFRAAMDDTADATAHRGTPIADAHRFFRQQAEEWLSAEGDLDERGAALSTALHGLFQLVVIDLEPHDNAQVIFETLNARGTPLLAADLVKNYVMQSALRSGLDAEAIYGEFWEVFDGPYWRHEIKQGRLTRPRIDMLLDYWLELQSGDEVPAHDVFPEFRRHMDRVSRDVLAVVQAVARDAAVYVQLQNDRSRTPEGIFLYRWEAMENQVVTPLLLWLFGQPVDLLSVEQRRLALRSIESFLVRRMVARRTTKNYNRLFLEALAHVKSGEVHDAGTRLTSFLAGQTADANSWPSDTEFATAFVTEPSYSRLKRARLRMILEALEDDLRSPRTEDQYVTRGSLTIEHLMPQGWTPAAWPLPGDSDSTAETLVRNRLLQTVGNLTLVTSRLNPELSHGPWEHKRPRIDEHGVLRLHSGFKNSNTWNEELIVSRSGALAQRAIAIWPHPESAPADIPSIVTRALSSILE